MNTRDKAAMVRHLRGTWAAATTIAQESRPITLRGIMARAGVSSTSVASYHVDKLIALGYLNWDMAPSSEGMRVLGGLTVLLPLGSYTNLDIKLCPGHGQE